MKQAGWLEHVEVPRKLAVLRSMVRQAYQLKAAGLRSLHPELPENEVLARARALVGGGRA